MPIKTIPIHFTILKKLNYLVLHSWRNAGAVWLRRCRYPPLFAEAPKRRGSLQRISRSILSRRPRTHEVVHFLDDPIPRRSRNLAYIKLSVVLMFEVIAQSSRPLRLFVGYIYTRARVSSLAIENESIFPVEFFLLYNSSWQLTLVHLFPWSWTAFLEMDHTTGQLQWKDPLGVWKEEDVCRLQYRVTNTT